MLWPFKYRVNSFILINIAILGVGFLGISNINHFVFKSIYGSDVYNFYHEFANIRQVKIIAAYFIIWALVVLQAFKMRNENCAYYAIAILHGLFWTLTLALQNAVGGILA